MNSELLLQYVEACKKAKEADAEKERLSVLVLAHLKGDLNLEKLQTDAGTFSLAKRVSYEYPTQLKEFIKKLQDDAVKNSSASIKTSEFLRFQAAEKTE